MNFGEKLYTLRKRSGISQTELAQKLGVSRQSVSKWETNESLPEVSKIMAIAKLFNVSIDMLLDDEQSPDEKNQTEETPPAAKKASGKLSKRTKGLLALFLVLLLVSAVSLWYILKSQPDEGELIREAKEKIADVDHSIIAYGGGLEELYQRIYYKSDGEIALFTLAFDDPENKFDYLLVDLHTMEIKAKQIQNKKVGNDDDLKETAELLLLGMGQSQAQSYWNYADFEWLEIKDIGYAKLSSNALFYSYTVDNGNYWTQTYIIADPTANEPFFKYRSLYAGFGKNLEKEEENLSEKDLLLMKLAYALTEKKEDEDYVLIDDKYIFTLTSDIYEFPRGLENVAPIVTQSEKYTIEKADGIGKGVLWSMETDEEIPVVAMRKGTIEDISYSDGLGYSITIIQDDGTKAVYGHLTDNIWHNVGEMIDQPGQQIGYTVNDGTHASLILYVESEEGIEINDYDSLFATHILLHPYGTFAFEKYGRYAIDEKTFNEISEMIEASDAFKRYNPGFKVRNEKMWGGTEAFGFRQYEISVTAQANDFPTLRIGQNKDGEFYINQSYRINKQEQNFAGSGKRVDFTMDVEHGYEADFSEYSSFSVWFNIGNSECAFMGSYDPLNRELVQDDTGWEQLKGIDNDLYEAVLDYVDQWFQEAEGWVDDVNELGLEIVDKITKGEQVKVYVQPLIEDFK